MNRIIPIFLKVQLILVSIQTSCFLFLFLPIGIQPLNPPKTVQPSAAAKIPTLEEPKEEGIGFLSFDSLIRVTVCTTWVAIRLTLCTLLNGEDKFSGPRSPAAAT